MLPGGITVGIIALALVPGWLYLRLSGWLRPSSEETTLRELLEVFAIGLATTGVGVLILILAPHDRVPFLLDINAWARQGNGYLRQNIRPAALSAAAALLVALTVAVLLYLAQRLRQSAEFRPQGSVWVHALGARPKGKLPWIGLQLNDGKFVEGVLHSYSLTEGGAEERDIALQRPIRVSHEPDGQTQLLDLDRFIVSCREIAHITVIHVPERRK